MIRRMKFKHDLLLRYFLRFEMNEDEVILDENAKYENESEFFYFTSKPNICYVKVTENF